MKINTLFIMLLLTGCSMEAAIQKSYAAKQEECRAVADVAMLSLTTPTMTAEQRNAENVNQYTLCMNKAGWKATNPLKPKVVSGPPAPGSTQPSILDAAKVPPAVANAPPAAAAPILQPSADAPSPQPAVRTPQPAPPMPAVISPAPVNPNAGNGYNVYYPNAEPLPGRQF